MAKRQESDSFHREVNISERTSLPRRPGIVRGAWVQPTGRALRPSRGSGTSEDAAPLPCGGSTMSMRRKVGLEALRGYLVVALVLVVVKGHRSWGALKRADRLCALSGI